MNSRSSMSFLVRRFIAVLALICLPNTNVLFGSTVSDIFLSPAETDSLFSPNDRAYNHYASQNIEAIPESTQGPDAALPDTTLKWHTMFTKIPADWSLFATRAFRVESIPMIVGLVGATGALYVIDHNTYRNSHDYERGSQRYRSFTDGLISVGDGKYQFGVIGCLALYGVSASDSHALKTASQMTEAILAVGIVVQVLKRVAGRESPIVATQKRGALRPFPNLADYERHQPKYYSFPSGHIATTTAALTVLCENFPEAKWMRPASFILVGAVGGSLVSKGWHWYSDLPLGIALGYSFGLIASHPEGFDVKKATKEAAFDVSVAPRLISSGAELQMVIHF